MPKILMFNICITIAYLIPILITEKASYSCIAGNVGLPSKTSWEGSDKTIMLASQIAQSACEKNSHSPEKCFIQDCHKILFK